VPITVHSGKHSSSAVLVLGEDLTPSVPSTFFWETSSLSATFGEAICFFKTLFPECCTRGRNLFFLKPSSLSVALGEEFCFFNKILSPSAFPRHSGKNISW
jgi:hypothetical protein